MLDPLEIDKQGRDRAERTGIWVSGIGHTVLLIWAAIGGALFVSRETPRPQATDVTTISAEEFEELAARSRGAGPVGQADGEAPVQPEAPGDTSAPEGPDLALDVPDPDSTASTLPTPPVASEDSPDLSDVENRTPPVDVATIAPDPAQPEQAAEATPDVPAADTTPDTGSPLRPETPDAGAAPDEPAVSELALTTSRHPPERPAGLREAVLAAQQAAEAEAAAAAAAQAEQDRQAALAEQAEQAEQERLAREAAERAEQQRLAEQQRAEEERRAEEARRQAEADRLAAEQAEAERRAEEARLAEEARRAEEERLAEEARRAEAERLAEQERLAEEARQQEEAERLAREAEERAAEDARAAAEAELARERDLAERLAEIERLQREAAQAQEATPSPFDGNAPEGEGEGGGSDVLTDALNEAGAAAIQPDQLDDALADAMGVTRPSEIVREEGVEIATVPMTDAEKDVFRDAVQGCWNQSTLSLDAAVTRVVVGFTMDRSGMPDPDSFRIVGDPEPDPSRQQAFEAARRAVIRCAAGGYLLPADKYNEWDDVEMTFTPAGVEAIE